LVLKQSRFEGCPALGLLCNSLCGPRTKKFGDPCIKVMSRKFVPALRQNREVEMDTVIHEQNGAISHWSNAFFEYIHRYSPRDRIIFCHTEHLWPFTFSFCGTVHVCKAGL